MRKKQFKRKSWFKSFLSYHFIKSTKDYNVWLFGAWKGYQFSDNSKYLYEYVTKKYPNIKAYWYTKDINIFNDLHSKGYNVILNNTKEAKELIRIAGYLFYSHGLDDFGEYLPVKKAIKICLWHGLGFKRNYLSDLTYKNTILRKIKNKLFDTNFQDYTVVTSDFCQKAFQLQFNLSQNHRYIRACFPRMEFIKKNIVSNNRVKNILFMPTHRPESRIIQNVISELNSKLMIDFLVEHDIKLNIKLHPLSNLDGIVLNDRIRIIKDANVEHLLLENDFLITDYSSVCTDFSILNKPLIFFTPDIEQYKLKPGIFNEFEENFSTIIIKKTDQLVKAIISTIKNLSDNLRIVKKLRELMFDSDVLINDGNEMIVRSVLSVSKKEKSNG